MRAVYYKIEIDGTMFLEKNELVIMEGQIEEVRLLPGLTVRAISS